MSARTQQSKPERRYLQLAEHLRRQIENGELRAGDRLPSYMDMRSLHGATQSTVERAHALLEQDGLIERIERRGIFVADRTSLPANSAPVATTDSQTIIAIGPHDHSFFDRCMHLVLRQAEDFGLTLVCRLCEADTDPATFHIGQARGILLFGQRLAPLGKRLQEEGHRVVIVGSVPANGLAEVPCVYADQEQGGYLVAKHLLELGHRRIAFGYDSQSPRWRGHERALREARTKVGDASQGELNWEELSSDWQSDPQLAAEYFLQPDTPTAIATWNDHAAASLLAVLTRAGIKVPGQVSLVGFDNLPESRLVHPPLTTVDSAIEQQLQAALSLLMRPVAPPSSHTVVVLPTLISRESSASAPKSSV